jgi:hypothetical protein
MKGARDGHSARDKRTGTGQASTKARTARKYEVQNMGA